MAQFVFSGLIQSPPYSQFLSVNWGWGIAVMMGVWVSGGVSGESDIYGIQSKR